MNKQLFVSKVVLFIYIKSKYHSLLMHLDFSGTAGLRNLASRLLLIRRFSLGKGF